MVGHFASGANSTGLSKGLEVLFTADVLQMRVGNNKVGREHGRSEFPAVGAVTKEGVN